MLLTISNFYFLLFLQCSKNEWSCGREEKALEKEKVTFLDFIAKETNKPNTNAAVQIEGSQETSKFRGTEEKDISNESP